MIKRLTSLFLAILLMLTTATVAETVTPEVVETWYGNVFGRVLTLTLMSDGSYEQCGDWHAYGTWEKDADGVLSGAYEGNPMEFALLEDGRLLFLEVITLGEGEDTEELYVYYIMKHPEN